LPLDPRVSDSNPSKGNVFLMPIKIRSMPSFGGEVKPSAPRFYSMLKIPAEYERLNSRSFLANSHLCY
jgi:hypothetical protein